MIEPAPLDPPAIAPQLWRGFSTGGTAWDVGANCGQTIPTLLLRFEHVVAFEPAEESYEYILDHVGMFDTSAKKLEVHKFAVSDKDGSVSLMAVPSKMRFGELVSVEAHGMEYDPSEGEPREVPCWTLDSLAMSLGTPPNFIKIDVEGHELHVLKGGRELLARERPELLIEIHSVDLGARCKSLLSELGYEIETVRHPDYPPGSDLWFTHFWYKCFSDR